MPINKNALIIFVRNPVEGKVKTRLAKTLGAKKTFDIYLKLLDHTKAITQEVDCDRYLYYSDFIDDEDFWPSNYYHKKLQQGNDLGARMLHAFEETFGNKYERIIIIGSDCAELTSLTLQEAFEKLDETDVVIGPATDGGYYLLGMKELFQPVFLNKEWSTSTVCESTISDLKSMNKSFTLLLELSDVDEEADVPIEWRDGL